MYIYCILRLHAKPLTVKFGTFYTFLRTIISIISQPLANQHIMSRDSAYSYAHLNSLSHVLHMELWKDSPIPFDDIDTLSLMEAVSNIFPNLLLDDDDEDGLPMSSSMAGLKLSKNRKNMQQNHWMDLSLHERYLNPNSNLHMTHDTTILQPLYTQQNSDLEYSGALLADFLANGRSHLQDQADIASPEDFSDSNIADVSTNLSTDIISHHNNTFAFKIRSNSGSGQAQTPRVRSRNPSTDNKGFQTPITRSMR